MWLGALKDGQHLRNLLPLPRKYSFYRNEHFSKGVQVKNIISRAKVDARTVP